MKLFLIIGLVISIIVYPNYSNANNLVKPWNWDQIDCLTKGIYYEAGWESSAGQELVAHTILNRVESNKFPNTICKVIYAPHQFSWTTFKKVSTINKDRWIKSQKIAYITYQRDYWWTNKNSPLIYKKINIEYIYWFMNSKKTSNAVKNQWKKVAKPYLIEGNHTFWIPK